MATPSKEELTIWLQRAQADVDNLPKDIAAVRRVKVACARRGFSRIRDRVLRRRMREAAKVLIQGLTDQLAIAVTLRDAYQGQMDLLYPQGNGPYQL